jgi:hypothetical protein
MDTPMVQDKEQRKDKNREGDRDSGSGLIEKCE